VGGCGKNARKGTREKKMRDFDYNGAGSGKGLKIFKGNPPNITLNKVNF